MPDPLRPAIGTLEPPPRLDALLPPEMAKRAEDIGVKKASMDHLTICTSRPWVLSSPRSSRPSSRPAVSQAQALSLTGFLARNLLPVTIGNVVGGTLLVGGGYFFVYLRPRREP